MPIAYHATTYLLGGITMFINLICKLLLAILKRYGKQGEYAGRLRYDLPMLGLWYWEHDTGDAFIDIDNRLFHGQLTDIPGDWHVGTLGWTHNRTVTDES